MRVGLTGVIDAEDRVTSLLHGDPSFLEGEHSVALSTDRDPCG